MAEFEFTQKEEEILSFWRENDIFKKSIANRKNARRFIFYEGPPTANGMPGLHHVLARSFKDLICRYKTMRGFLTERKAGWDTHGLPVELEVEKEIGFKSKTEIERYGIKEFNIKAKQSVWRYKSEWEKLTERMAYWIDADNPYITFDNSYIETVWWLLQQINKRNLLYKSYKVLPYCPRCSTPLSSHEVSSGYQTVSDPSLYLKFEIPNPKSEHLKQIQSQNFKIYLLVWTTTPWTLPANTALAVDEKLDYKLWQTANDEILISYIQPPEGENKLMGQIKGQELTGEKYNPLYCYSLQGADDKKIYEVVTGDFISIEEGTGIVHIAPAFGEDDMELSKKANLTFIKNINDKGYFIEAPQEVPEIQNKFFKDADSLIFQNLEKRNLLHFGDLKGTVHEYPFCWRCQTPLLYFAFEAWYIKMSQLREELIKNNGLINWVPEHIKEGRFGQWLREVKDWTISRNRYWGTPLPIWECQECGHYEVIGSINELPNKPLNDSGEIDLHRPYVDEIMIRCPKCGIDMRRRGEVIDCWFDSGAMPFAQSHFPFKQFQDSNPDIQEMVKAISFPADYICEGVDQTRGWFYTLLAIATALGLGPAYKNVISLGLILDSKGEKMSKSKGNVVDPMKTMEQYGADALRWYLYTINSPGEEKRFNESDLINIQRRFLNTLWNVFIFYRTYAAPTGQDFNPSDLSELNQWILAELEELKQKTINHLDNYHIYEAAKEIDLFLDSLSRWYIRRSRRIFQKPDNPLEWQTSSLVLKKVIKELIVLLAPFCPFISETLWQDLKSNSDSISVHLADYPALEKQYQNQQLLNLMSMVRDLTNKALSLRQKKGIKVRQPLRELRIRDLELRDKKELLKILQEEINVKEIVFDPLLKEEIELDIVLTKELIEEGIIREVIRQIQDERKKQNLSPKDKIKIILECHNSDLRLVLERWSDFLKTETGAEEFQLQAADQHGTGGVIVNGETIGLKIQKI